VTSVDGTTGTNPNSVNTKTATVTLNITGSDPGGGIVTYFEVFVSIDSGPYMMVNGTAIPAGPPDSQGDSHATITYLGLTDGAQYQYHFYIFIQPAARECRCIRCGIVRSGSP
jgi:hypothetical protein